MKPLDNLVKEELDEGIAYLRYCIKTHKEMFNYDEKEMIEYVIKKFRKEK